MAVMPFGFTLVVVIGLVLMAVPSVDHSSAFSSFARKNSLDPMLAVPKANALSEVPKLVSAVSLSTEEPSDRNPSQPWVLS